MKKLLIRPVANGYIVEPYEHSMNCTIADSELHVFTTPAELAVHIEAVAANHEKTRDAAKDLRTALDG